MRIFQINTCLWGGMFNPIIPFFKRVPVWWERPPFKFDKASQVLNGYLDFFEPDYVVEAEKGLANGLGFEPKRVLQLSDILVRSDDRNERGYGLSVIDLYRKLYKEEYQFVRRHKHPIITTKTRVSAFSTFAACVFGSFPEQASLQYFAKGYKEAFDSEEITIDASALQKVYQSQSISPLRIGCSNLEVNFNDQQDPALFIMDATEPRDLIDYWNYRAIHGRVRPVPLQWLPELADQSRGFIARTYRPLPGNRHGVMITAKVMFSRSIPEKDIEGLHSKYLKVDKPDANRLQPWYPPFWRPSPQIMFRPEPPTIEYQSKKIDVPLQPDSPYIQFQTLSPDFAERFGNKVRWANVITLQDWSHKDRLATVFPCDYRSPKMPKFGLGDEQPLSTTEGLVIFPRFKDHSEMWGLTDGAEAVSQWLKDYKITTRLSESGRATQQIIQTLGGFYGVRNVALKGVVQLLDGMSRTPITRSAHKSEFQNRVKTAVGDSLWRNAVFENLVERKAVELGLELKCSKCGSWSWYRLSQLNSEMTCELCLRSFEFPAADPYNSDLAKWAYRVIGPFALPDYAKGGYAAALAIRFFAGVIGKQVDSATTWSPGQELTFPDGAKIEADFLLWQQRKNHLRRDGLTETVFGEAKSFGREAFTRKDVVRMKAIAMAFPGAILVFATMKEASELSKREIRLIRSLAEWGRKYDKSKAKSRAAVIVLTGTELFAAHDLHMAWNEKGGRHQELVAPAYVRVDDLRILADLTQQLYLGMPSYGSWREQQWRKKAQRFRKPGP